MASYEKSKASGLWSVRFRETDASGTHNKRLSGYKTKKEAQYAYEDYITQSKTTPEETPKPDVNPSRSFDDIYEQFVEYKRTRLKPSSFYDLTQKMRTRIVPYFSGKLIKDITPIDILGWLKTLDTAKYKYKYKKDLFNYLLALYNFGEKYYDIKNIMKFIDRPRNLEPKKEMLTWSPEEFEQFIQFIEKPAYKMFYKFLYISGCRVGEASALNWEDFDFESNTVNIYKTAEYKVGTATTSYSITPPKTASSNRTVTLPQFFVEELLEYKKWQEEKLSVTTFVFGGKAPLPPTSITRHLNNGANLAGVKRIRIHDFRHSCASYLIHNMYKGVTIVGVSKRLGHSSVKQTLDTYAHLMPVEQDTILSVLDELNFPK